MNLPSGHKRINSAYTQPYSGQKLTPRTTIGSLPIQKTSGSRESFTKIPNSNTTSASKNKKGSILFQNLPLKLEGDLMASSKRQSRDNSHTRSPTPNKSLNSARPLGSQNFKSNVSDSNGNANKIKKVEFSGTSLNKPGLKNVKSLIHKSNRDPLNMSNLSNISSNNRIRLNDPNNSFVGSDPLNRTRVTSSKGVSLTKNILNLKQRSGTPNSKIGSTTQITKSNSDLHKRLINSKSPLSRSPNNLSKFSNKIQSVGNLTPNLKMSNYNYKPQNKSAFDTGLIKQLNDFKNNKSPTPHILKNLNNSFKQKPLVGKISGGPITKKVISGNLINMNMSNDASTNSTSVPKDSQGRDASPNYTNITPNNISTNFVNSLLQPSNITFHVNNNNSQPIVKKDTKEEKSSIERINLQKEKEIKGTVDFREITTSPLLRVFNF